MREFKCKSLGNNCSWKHTAKTEELLADITAIHLRDVHGVREITPDMLGRIRNLFSSAATRDAAAETDPVMKEYHCDMDSGCSWRYIAMTEDLIADGAAVHAREAHGVAEFTPEMVARVKQSVHPWSWEREKEKKAA